jgi:hypothetical protein
MMYEPKRAVKQSGFCNYSVQKPSSSRHARKVVNDDWRDPSDDSAANATLPG